MPGFILSGASLASPGPSTTPAVNTLVPPRRDCPSRRTCSRPCPPRWPTRSGCSAASGSSSSSPARTPAPRSTCGSRASAAVAVPRRLARRRRTTRAHDYRGADLGLETAVEAEPVRAHHARLAVEAGVQLRGRSTSAGLNDLFAAAYPYVPVAAVAADRRRRVAGLGRHPQHRRPRAVRGAHAAAGRHRGAHWAASGAGCPRRCGTRPSSGSVAGCAGTKRRWSTRASPWPGTRPARSTRSRSPRRPRRRGHAGR